MLRWFRKRSEKKRSNTDEPAGNEPNLEAVLGFELNERDTPVFLKALRHRSKIDGKEFEKSDSYERLEFLGDAVLDLIVTELLFERFPDETEGFLTKLRAKIVRGETLAILSKSLKINELIQIGDKAQGQGIEFSKSILADVFEALIAAIYLTKGYNTAFQFVETNIDSFLDITKVVKQNDNYKSILLEHTQAEKMSLPDYKIISEHGPGHNKTFSVSVSVDGKILGTGKGKSKKQAEQIAAKNAMKNLLDRKK
ncbi:MAG: ribonuclease III [Balneolaceae bacterium]